MDKILIIDFGGQTCALLARRVREMGVFSIILPHTKVEEGLKDPDVKGIILSGGPNSVFDETSPKLTFDPNALSKPILAVCYGAQSIAYALGGKIVTADKREYGPTKVNLEHSSKLFSGVASTFSVFMSHHDQVEALPKGFETLAKTETCPNAAFSNESKGIYCVQFHPEVTQTEPGKLILKNFVIGICGAKPSWDGTDFIERKIKEIQEQTAGKDVLLALSGGVDSAVTCALLSRAIGKRLHAVFVDHGLMRKNEPEQVRQTFGPGGRFELDFRPLDKGDYFLDQLKGVTDPETKRKIIGKCFIDVFHEEALKIDKPLFLAQGTIYPDCVESGVGGKALIKSHHNVGGLPKDLPFLGLVEPLRDLFKDEVREVGALLGLPEEIVNRQPFPGPGLGVRVKGELTRDKLAIVREADAIFREEVGKLEHKPGQYFAALLDTKSVGVKGDERCVGYIVALRAVDTDDFMTAEPSPLPYGLLATVSKKIVDSVDGVSRVYYDYTSKPPATIELE